MALLSIAVSAIVVLIHKFMLNEFYTLTTIVVSVAAVMSLIMTTVAVRQDVKEKRNMARNINNAKEMLVLIEPFLHKVVRRHAPGCKDDGMISIGDYCICNTLTENEECLGCTTKRILDEQG